MKVQGHDCQMTMKVPDERDVNDVCGCLLGNPCRNLGGHNLSRLDMDMVMDDCIGCSWHWHRHGNWHGNRHGIGQVGMALTGCGHGHETPHDAPFICMMLAVS